MFEPAGPTTWNFFFSLLDLKNFEFACLSLFFCCAAGVPSGGEGSSFAEAYCG